MTTTSESTPHKNTIIAMTLLLALWMAPFAASAEDLASFCERLPRPAYAAFAKHAASNDWFEIYEVGPGIFAIYEPFQWQEVISYLIIGIDEALLFDTGNGLGDIKAVVDQLTDKPVAVLNSHTHFDHIGGNFQFDKILSVSTAFSIANSHGVENDMVTMEASPEALCKGLPMGVTQAGHRIKSFTIAKTVKQGDIIDLGNRKLEILQVPGHTDDAIALLDREAGFLWTGDTFYEGPIWLYFPETDLAAYKQSIARLAALAPQLNALFPAHNTPRASPTLLPETQKAFDIVLAGKATPVPTWEGVVTFEFDGFGFLMREDYTSLKED
ncbi:MAG: MBL fold metallo-hydrolase [Gammaproteobacteria bacterium]|jgi:glyoxylase-like metal-dependent hydrolase (beta-lactamase superfamily II)|nr:MBL fold metallo-hydrolase [Gammaproteobacteria bacterium]